MVERPVGCLAGDLLQVFEWPINAEGLVRNRRELEEVTNEDNAYAAKELICSARKDLAEAFVDPRKPTQTQHTFLVNHKIPDVS